MSLNIILCKTCGRRWDECRCPPMLVEDRKTVIKRGVKEGLKASSHVLDGADNEERI